MKFPCQKTSEQPEGQGFQNRPCCSDHIYLFAALFHGAKLHDRSFANVTFFAELCIFYSAPNRILHFGCNSPKIPDHPGGNIWSLTLSIKQTVYLTSATNHCGPFF